MASPFRPYQKLVQISLLGRPAQVPENNFLLRCFQFLAPEEVSYGAFCWNEECQHCRVRFRPPGQSEWRVGLSCKIAVVEGMEIASVDEEIRRLLALPPPVSTPAAAAP